MKSETQEKTENTKIRREVNIRAWHQAKIRPKGVWQPHYEKKCPKVVKR